MSGFVRTYYIDRDLWKKAKTKAAARLTSLSAIISALLRRWLDGEIEV